MTLERNFIEQEIAKALKIIEKNCDRFGISETGVLSDYFEKNGQTESGGKSVKGKDEQNKRNCAA